MFKYVIFAIIGFLNLQLVAQETAIANDRLKTYKEGLDFFEKKLYEASRHSIKKYLEMSQNATDGQYPKLQNEAAILYSIAGLRLGNEEAENELNALINHHLPDPIAYPAILELGSFYYNKKLYKKSIDTYSRLNPEALSPFEKSEASFKKGYSYFVTKQFKEAKQEFIRVRSIQNSFYYPVNYYLGVSEYFLGNYNDAIYSLERAAKDESYKSYIPYYLCQIYFAQKQYDKVVSNGEKALADPQLENRTEIRLLIGQSYFNQNNYAQALPHLEYYEANTAQLTAEEFYQLGFTQYQLKKYEDAIKNFNELNLLDSKLGQLVNYYLADSYLKTGDKVSARAAFKKVSQMPYEKSMQEEALFNFGKLSAESGFEREAVNTFVKIDEKSPFYHQSVSILTEILDNSADYENTMIVIDGLPKVNDKLKLTYQKASLKHALQLYSEQKVEAALAGLQKSLKYTSSRNLEAQSRFWIAQIHNENGQINESIKGFQTYFDLSNGLTDLPEESDQYMANYTQGYNHLYLKDYKNAERSFKNSVSGFNVNRSKIKNTDLLKKILPDARIRLGDCLFKQKNYKEAMIFYDQAITAKDGGFVYAMYQKAIIEGLLGEPYEKIVTLNDLKRLYPNSEYADDALMQLGDTYLDLGNTNNAYASFTELVNNYKGKTTLMNAAYLKMGLIAYNKGDLQTAINNYKAVFQNNPNAKESQSALIGLEEIYISDLGKSEEYVQFLSTIPGYEINAFSADSLSFKVGELRYNNGEYDRAVLGFNNYLQQYPNGYYKLNAYYLRAESNSILKKYTEALVDYENIVNAGINQYYDQSVRKAALISYNHTQNFQKSLLFYELHYQNTKSENEKYQAALGALRSAFRQSNDQKVMQYSTIVVENKIATQEDIAVAYYYQAKVAFRKKDFAQAIISFQKAAELANNNQAAESRYMIAEIYFIQNNFDLAEKQCNEANSKNSNYPFWIAKSLILLSDIYLVKDDLFNARAALEAVLENFKDDADLVNIAKEKLKIVETKENDATRIKTINPNLLELQPKKGN